MDILRIKAYTANDAKAIASGYGFKKLKNVTRSWRNQNCPTGNKFKEFQVEILRENFKRAKPGVGCFITVTPGLRLSTKQ